MLVEDVECWRVIVVKEFGEIVYIIPYKSLGKLPSMFHTFRKMIDIGRLFPQYLIEEDGPFGLLSKVEVGV
jgi:hypothetical protein